MKAAYKLCTCSLKEQKEILNQQMFFSKEQFYYQKRRMSKDRDLNLSINILNIATKERSEIQASRDFISTLQQENIVRIVERRNIFGVLR